MLGVCTLDGLLKTALLEIPESSKLSKSCTVPKDKDPPTAFKYWSEFDGQMAKVKDFVKSREYPKYDTYIQQGTDGDQIQHHNQLADVFRNLGKAYFLDYILVN